MACDKCDKKDKMFEILALNIDCKCCPAYIGCGSNPESDKNCVDRIRRTVEGLLNAPIYAVLSDKKEFKETLF